MGATLTLLDQSPGIAASTVLCTPVRLNVDHVRAKPSSPDCIGAMPALATTMSTRAENSSRAPPAARWAQRPPDRGNIGLPAPRFARRCPRRSFDRRSEIFGGGHRVEHRTRSGHTDRPAMMSGAIGCQPGRPRRGLDHGAAPVMKGGPLPASRGHQVVFASLARALVTGTQAGPLAGSARDGRGVSILMSGCAVEKAHRPCRTAVPPPRVPCRVCPSVRPASGPTARRKTKGSVGPRAASRDSQTGFGVHDPRWPAYMHFGPRRPTRGLAFHGLRTTVMGMGDGTPR